MNAARKKSHSRSQRDDGAPDRGLGWLAGIVIALLAARFLLPTEAAVDGETLWLVQLWILAVAVWGWRQYLRGRPMIHWDLGTLAVALLVAGHLVSGFVLFSRGGDKRAAVNMMWEWVSLGITFLIVRSVLAENGARRIVIWALACVGVSLAGLGEYQYFVTLPRTAKEYRQNRAEFDELVRKEGSGTKSKRHQQLENWFRDNEIPPDGPKRKQFEARLLSSTEPFATFGLANTLAGLLAVFLLPAVAVTMAAVSKQGDWSIFRPSTSGTPKTPPRKMDLSPSSRRPFSWLAPAIIVLLLTACLILTKSRTAWVGGIAGGVVWWWTSRAARSSGRRWLGWAVAAILAIVVVAVGAALTGGLDRKVLSESPKSLRYRWQYWTGTVGVLKELPLFGPGPGNFRQRYLKHKLPESSEEIRDPHNLVLDVWCNGGVIALAGLLLLFAWSARGVRLVVTGFSRSSAVFATAGGDGIDRLKPVTTSQPRTGIAGIAAGCLLVIAYVWFLNEGNLPRLWALLAGAVVAWLMTWRNLRTTPISTACLAGAGTALAVHLLGAGGIEMPAVTQVLLLLAAAVVPSREPSSDADAAGVRVASRLQFAAAMAMTAIAAVLFGTCLSTATIPVLTRQAAMMRGEQRLRENSPREAERMFKAAAIDDPLSPEPARRLAELAIARWQKSPQTKARLESAIRLQNVAIGLDPYHFTGYLMLGRWYALMHEIGGSPADLAASLQAYRQAVELYPSNVRLLAEFARVLEQAGKPAEAADVAKRALELDDLNHREGHTDKYLPEEFRQRLVETIRKTKRPSGAGNRN